jgi:hypothetical protein
LIGENLDLGGDDCETPAGFTGAGRLDGGVQGQQIGLCRNDTVGESFGLNVAAAQEAGTLIETAGPIILAQGSVRTKWNYSYSFTTHAGSIFPACPASICLK